ncbi:MAG: exodeoxyribonuclease VII small subunit [Firmicutes bacterium]|nr:exodeoxyribonuclease VII small subunit [Bacillota bacterium]
MSEMKFEDALARLEEIVRSLEQGEALLDEALVLFEEGVKLARFCNEQLDQAEAKIEMMLSNGQIETFEVNET